MLTIGKLLKGLCILLLCFTTWMTIRIVGFVLSDFPNENVEFVPNNAYFAMRVDGRELAETTLFTLLFNAKDEEVIDLIKEKSKKIQGKKTSLSGVNPLSDIVLFKVEEKGIDYTGVLLNLIDSKKFLHEIKAKFKQNVGVCTNKNVGLILFSTSQSQQKLQKKSKEFLAVKHDKNHSIFYKSSSKKRLTELHLHQGDQSDAQEISLSFEQDSSFFNVNGTSVSKNDIKESTSKFFLVPRGIHISNYSIPGPWADSLQKIILNTTSLNLPSIKAFSMNYLGVDVLNHPSGYVPLPDMDIVLEFNKPLSIQQFLSDLVAKNQFICEMTDQAITIEGKTLYFKQLDDNIIYIGRSKDPKYMQKKNNCVVLIKGNLSPLSNIQGGGLMTNLLALSPAFQATKVLGEKTEYIDLEITKTSSRKVSIIGKMKFKEGNYPINEVLRFLLVSSN
ncbi:MAG: hypothetical protein V4638_04605 [Bacteroidota bacterium]